MPSKRYQQKSELCALATENPPAPHPQNSTQLAMTVLLTFGLVGVSSYFVLTRISPGVIQLPTVTGLPTRRSLTVSEDLQESLAYDSAKSQFANSQPQPNASPARMPLLLATYGLDAAWFEYLCKQWATLTNQNWAELLEEDKVNIANDLLYRLSTGLHRETLTKMGRHDHAYYVALKTQREHRGQLRGTAHKLADKQFYQLFPELKQHQHTIRDTGFDAVWYGMLEDVVYERSMPTAQDIALRFEL